MQGGLLTGQTVRDLCGIRNANPELNYVTPANASGPGNVCASPVFPYCHTSTGFTTRVTGLATYTVPKIDVLVSGTFRSEQGAPLAANFTVTNAMVSGSSVAISRAGRQRRGEPHRAGNDVWRPLE